MQILITSTEVEPFKKGQVYSPAKIGFFTPDDKVTAIVEHEKKFYILSEDNFQIKVKKPKKL